MVNKIRLKKATQENCLANRFPEIAKQWHPAKNGNLTPNKVCCSSLKKVCWICNKNHEWLSTIYHRIYRKSNCPYCSNKKVNNENCLLTTNPTLSKEWNYKINKNLTPLNVVKGSHKKVWWICKKCSWQWQSTIDNRSRGQGCPNCAGKIVNKSNNLKNKSSFLSIEWDYNKNGKLTPEKVHHQSNKNVWWICNKNNNHSWQDRINNRYQDNKCPYCLLEEKSLFTKYPNLAKEWNYQKNKNLNPDNVFAGSKKNVWWICPKSHEFVASIVNRTDKKQGCPYCSGKKVSDSNSLSSLYPWLASEWHPNKNWELKPQDVSFGSERKVWWKCKRGHEWSANIYSRVCGRNCPYCRGILLKDNTLCGSYAEAIRYIEYKEKELIFEHNKTYHTKLGKCRYDFYFPQENKYVEVTSYNKNILTKYNPGFYFKYFRRIIKKKRFVENILKARFEFIQFIPTQKQIKKVREWMK
jgi:DNA-directed RNA polymerase subunit RPC12/RpoP